MQSRIIDDKYRIVRELSKGGMGAVYEARHVRTDRKVALKLILADALGRETSPDALRRFEREARAGGSIDSSHVVPVTDTGIDAATGSPYIVMELLVGEDLRELVRRHATLPVDLVLRAAAQACLGLERAHEQGIVHRDIKAGNLFLARRDDGRVEVTILDFGIAKLRVEPLSSVDGHDLTRTGAVLGSPLYMSPEQATGARDIDGRADLWSLGVVMYEALTGRTPHAKQTLGGLILAICSQPARPLREIAPWVPSKVAALVHKALSLEPAQRFESARAMRLAIEAMLPLGSAIDESMVADAGKELRVPLASEPPPTPGLTPHGQTTSIAVTFGPREAAPKARPAPGTGRRLALFAAAGALTAVAAVALSRAGTGAPTEDVSKARDANREPSSAEVASIRTPSPPAPVPSPPPPSVVPPATASSSPAQSAVPRVVARKVPRAPARPNGSSRVSVETPAAPHAAAFPVASPPRTGEPAIDRRFE
jgi:serine/threonine-protein kinase